MRPSLGTYYEFSNRSIPSGIGNVRAIISDCKNPEMANLYTANNTAEIQNINNYYSFGMPMHRRNYTSGAGAYRFGFNGKEKDDELKGEGNSLDFGARIYDSRLGRWLSLDPLMKKYPDLSPYSSMANNPIFFIDKGGKAVYAYTAESKALVIKALNYALGKGHGFHFEGDKLCAPMIPKTENSQSLVYYYINMCLVETITKNIVLANTDSYSKDGVETKTEAGDAGKTENVKLTKKIRSTTYPENSGYVNYIIGEEVTFENRILITPETMQKGVEVAIAMGSSKMGADYALLHEFGHAIVNTIMNEMGGVFNGVNFKNMSDKQREDWAIKFTNKILQEKMKAKETGAGQHGRNNDETPPKQDVAPIKE